MSHGQASVERIFFVEQSHVKTNLLAENLISRRIIKDHILSVGGVQNVQITSEMLKNVAMSHRRYKDELELKKNQNEKAEKRKRDDEEIEVLKRRKHSISSDVERLEARAYALAEEASVNGSTELFQEAHALTTRAKTLKETVLKLQKEIESKGR